MLCILSSMLNKLQSLVSTHPQANPHAVASIQWQKQHYQNNAIGSVIQRLAETVEGANSSAQPYLLTLEGADTRNSHLGPYHLTPVWNDALKTLKIEISNDRIYTPDSDVITTINLPIALIKDQLTTLSKESPSANASTVAKNTGSIAIREYMMNLHITPSDSLARGLFEALVGIHNERSQCKGR